MRIYDNVVEFLEHFGCGKLRTDNIEDVSDNCYAYAHDNKKSENGVEISVEVVIEKVKEGGSKSYPVFQPEIDEASAKLHHEVPEHVVYEQNPVH